MSAAEDLNRRGEVLQDSRATLRQVERVLGELGSTGGNGVTGRSSLPELVEVLIRTHEGIMDVVRSLQHTRGVIQRASVERLQVTTIKLREVSSATEMAATGMLDGLDRALEMVDRLEGGPGQDGERSEVANHLRDELHGLISLLQFQDITSQQLAYASGVLADVEDRLTRILEIFGSDWEEGGGPDPVQWANPRACDPEATASGAVERQAVADEIFPGV